jgi:uncharacterized membrane protein YfcA
MTWPAESWPLLLSLAGVLFVSGLVQSSLGFGFALTALAVLPYVVDARQAHLIVSLSGVPPLILTAWVYRQRTMLLPLAIALMGACLSLPIGLLVFSKVPLVWLVCMTGGAVFLFALGELRRPAVPAATDSSGASCFLAGAVSGFLAGALSIGGPPIVAFALRQTWPPVHFRFFVCFFLMLQSLVKGLGLIGSGQVDQRVAILAVWSVPFTLLGVWLGARLTSKIEPARYRRFIALALMVSGLSLIWRSWMSLLGG